MSVSEMDQSVFDPNVTEVVHHDDSKLRRKLVGDFEIATPTPVKPGPSIEDDAAQSDLMKVYLRVRPLTVAEIEQKQDQVRKQ